MKENALVNNSAANQGSNDPISFAIPEITEEDVEAVTRVLRSGWITTGTECAMFEEELAHYLEIEHVVACSSATTAEEICLAYLDPEPGARFAVPAWTFVSTALGVHRAGGVPVLVDVDPDTLNLCPAALERAADEGLAGVVGVHFSGNPMSSDIRKICEAYDLPLVEDAAHALGARDDRGLIAGRGTAGACYSFYATKNLPTGEGGAIATDDAGLAEFARTYRLHGMSSDAIDRYKRPGAHSYDVEVPGLKANLPDLLATLGRSQLRRFESSQAHRRALVLRYRENLDSQKHVRFVPPVLPEGSADHLMVISLDSQARRDAVVAGLAADNIGSSVHFRPLHTFAWFKENNIPLGPGGVPNTDRLDGSVMSLPLHVGLSLSDIDRVCGRVIEALG
ncbi:MAG: dTDP-4-amino-4,6-dideoxygalactose transaminase [Acidimicrobiales bacterium]|jgi:dTDP-4-amino-4,6-dideoxygalactose transaminase